MQSPLHEQQQNEPNNGDSVHPNVDESQTSTLFQPVIIEDKDTNEIIGGGEREDNSSKNTENEQQIVQD